MWSSADGKTWTEVTNAPGSQRSGHDAYLRHHQMWMMGGRQTGWLPGHSASSAVWSSRTPNGRRSRRRQAGHHALPQVSSNSGDVCGFSGSDYYFGDARSLKNDVWSSADGRTWKQETADAGWPPRAYHQAVVHGGKIWIFGGGNYVPQYEVCNDVWSSEDGIHWTQVIKAAPWPARLWF